MATAVERLYKLTVDGSAAVRQLEKIAKSTGNLDTQLSKITGTVKSAVGGFLAFETLQTAAQAFGGLIDALGDFNDQAEQLGLSTQAMQEFNAVASLAGVSSETVSTAFVGLAKTMDEAKDSSSDTAKLLKELGLSLDGLSKEDAFFKIADFFASLPPNTDKSTLALELFGKAGIKLIPILNQGSEAIKANASAMRELGIIVNDEAIKAADKLGDEWAKLKGQATGLATFGLTPLIERLARATEQMNLARIAGEGFFATLGKGIAGFAGFANKAEQLANIETRIAKKQREIQSMGDLFGGRADEIKVLRAQWAALAVDVNAAAQAEEAAAAARMGAAPGEDPIAAARARIEAEKLAEEAAKKSAAARKTVAAEEKATREQRVTTMIEQLKIEERLNEIAAEQTGALTTEQQKIKDVIVARTELTAALKAEEETKAKQVAQWEVLTDWLHKGTEAQRAYAEAAIVGGKTTRKGNVELEDMSKSIETVMASNFESFFTNIQNGALKAKDAFKQMAQSILAQILRLIAQRAILAAFGLNIGGAPVKTAQGAAFLHGRKMQAFASGGVLNQPTFFPMAHGTGLAGEAGPEGVFPLRRTATGDLGVQGTQPIVNVQVTNMAPGTTASARQDGNDVQVLIEQTKQAIMGDIRSGGNRMASTFERTYGVGRVAGAR